MKQHIFWMNDSRAGIFSLPVEEINEVARERAEVAATKRDASDTQR